MLSRAKTVRYKTDVWFRHTTIRLVVAVAMLGEWFDHTVTSNGVNLRLVFRLVLAVAILN